MKRFITWMFAAFAILLLLLFVIPAQAEPGNNGYDISWWTVDSGGATFSTGGDYSLGSTVGQADADVLTGGVYTLAGGFWGGGAAIPPQHRLYLPSVMR